jgi:hypothetical protein
MGSVGPVGHYSVRCRDAVELLDHVLNSNALHPGQAEVAGLAWCSIATLHSNGGKLHRSPARRLITRLPNAGERDQGTMALK